MVTAMDTIMNMILIDIHNHSMPYVDDGSKDSNMTFEMLSESKKQGVSKIIFTPHVNSSVTKSNRTKHIEVFNKLKLLESKLDMNFFLGAEIYIPFRIPDINFADYTMGDSKYLLLEFSTISETPITDHCYNLIKKGYKIIIAHIERYNYLNFEDINELKSMGVYIQVNSSSFLNTKNKNSKKIAITLLKSNLIDFIATDTHNITSRKPNLKEAYNKVRKLVGKIRADKIFFINPSKILNI